MRQQQKMRSSSAAPASWRSHKQSTRMLIGRITACDPALPCFGPSSSGPIRQSPPAGPAAIYRDSGSKQPPGGASESSMFIEGGDWTPSMWTHLRPDSAIVVEVMHSNPGVMGYADPLGDFDFFPNGFDRQPGCGKEQAAAEEASQKQPSSEVRVRYQQQPAAYQHRRMKRQWSMLNRIMSSVTSPFASSSSLSHPVETPVQQQATAAQEQLKGATSSIKSEASRFSQTLDRLINPIKSFFKGNTCSHHRSVEYMVESLYYDRVPQDRKLDRDMVCQMVGYRCQDYASFKKGFCFKCPNADLDCRAFGMSLSPTITDGSLRANQLASHQLAPLKSHFEMVATSGSRQLSSVSAWARDKFSPSAQKQQQVNVTTSNQTNTTTTEQQQQQRLVKRVLPTFDHYQQSGYQPQTRNQYFFDTRPERSFCLHHYQIYVKYRWWRVRDNIMLDGFRILGTLANLTRKTAIQLHRFTHNSFTALLSEPLFLGQIESIILFGAKVKPTLIEYVEITFMSNLDPKIRALGSARLCRAQQPAQMYQQVATDQVAEQLPVDSLFVRCSGSMAR